MSPPITGLCSESATTTTTNTTATTTVMMENKLQDTPPTVEPMETRKKRHHLKPLLRKQRLRPQKRTLMAFRLARTALFLGIGSSCSMGFQSSSFHVLPLAAVSAFVSPCTTLPLARHRQRMMASGSSSSRISSTTTILPPLLRLYSSSSSHSTAEDEDDDNENTIKRQVVDSQQLRDSSSGSSSNSSGNSTQQRLSRVKRLAKNMIQRPFSLATTVPMPSAIAAILQEASLAAVEQAMDVSTSISSSLAEERMQSSSSSIPTNNNNNNKYSKGGRRFGGNRSNDEDNVDKDDDDDSNNMDVTIEDIIEEAFAPMEASLNDMELSLELARSSLQQAKQQSYEAMQALQMAATAQAEAAVNTVAQVEKQLYSMEEDVAAVVDVDISTLTLDDVDFASSEMAPPYLDSDMCLVPGEPIVRLEKAPENSRRIFAGIDILASVDDVWKVLTNYAELQKVVPNLVVNDVLELYDGSSKSSSSIVTYDRSAPEEVQCQQIAQQMKGSLLKQVGGAKVAGIRFSAKTTLEVREWPQGLPDFAHFTDDMWDGKSRDERAQEYPKIKLKRYRFPRPFAVSKLPTRDISMQSIPDDDGEFRLYQGVWRMQPLPGCAPPGKQAMRLTYAVEISPRAYLPVSLVERRIVQDLCTNLEAIRNAVTTKA